MKELDTVRAKFPEYADMDDSTLAQKLAAKFPAYADLPVRVEVESKLPQKSSPFDSEIARNLMPAGGQMLGGLAAGTMATPVTGGVGTVPAAVAGGIGGGMMGESLRQFLASVTGGGPQSYAQQGQELLGAGQNAALGELVPPVAMGLGGLVAKGAGMAARTIYRNIPDPVLDWVKTRSQQGVDVFAAGFEDVRGQLFPVLERLGKAVQSVTQKAPEVQAPSPASLYPVAEKAANALDAVREQVGKQYGAAAAHALEQPARASLAKAGQFLKTELKQMGILDYHNRPQPFGKREFTSEEQTLLNAYYDLTGMSPNPIEGMPEATSAGTFINYDRARRLLGRVDELMASAKLRNTQRVLGTVRRSIMDGLKQSDDQLAKRIPQYGQFVGIRDMVESAFTDPDKAVSLLTRSLSDTKMGLRGKLEALDAMAPPQSKFYKDLLAYQQKVADAETSKRAVKTVSGLMNRLNSMEAGEALARKIFEQKETTLAELEALERLTGSSFLTDLKDFAARQTFRSFQPTGWGYPTNMVLGGLGYSMGGPVGTAAGALAGTAMSAPRVQAAMLQRLLPMQQGAQRMGQSMAGMAPTLPPAIAALIRQIQVAQQ